MNKELQYEIERKKGRLEKISKTQTIFDSGNNSQKNEYETLLNEIQKYEKMVLNERRINESLNSKISDKKSKFKDIKSKIFEEMFSSVENQSIKDSRIKKIEIADFNEFREKLVFLEGKFEANCKLNDFVQEERAAAFQNIQSALNDLKILSKEMDFDFNEIESEGISNLLSD